MRELILDLCGGTGSWSKPYIEAGYDVRIVDKLTTGEDVRFLNIPKRQVRGVLAAPPCTHFSSAGARWWQEKGDAAVLEGLAVVDACIRIITMCKPEWWALENPEGRLRKFLGSPSYVFNPNEFGHPWTKKTLIWGDFTYPCKSEPIEPVFGKWGQQDSERADRVLRRSMTPSGFAKAFFDANP
jgi:site-specific DNA-cytosine methylase